MQENNPIVTTSSSAVSSIPVVTSNATVCSFNGQTVTNGSSITAYQSASVLSGQVCQLQQRTCNNGTLSGTYTYPTCSVSVATTCKIHVSECPAYPTIIGTYGTSFLDTYHGTTSTQAECLARAKDYAYWCNTMLPTSASFWQNGSLVAQQSYSRTLAGQDGIEQLPSADAGLTNPLIQFGNGRVKNGSPDLFSGYPSISGFPPTTWFVTQWKKEDYMQPTIMSSYDSGTKDPVFGLAQYAFSTTRYLSHVWMYPDPTNQQGKGLIYELFSTSGLFDSTGGSSNHLETWTINPSISVTAPLYEIFNTKVKNMVTNYVDTTHPTPEVVSLYYTVMTVRFTDPVTASTTDAFLQILHSDSRHTTATYSMKYANYFEDYLNDNHVNINYIALLPDDQTQYLGEATPNDALSPMQFDVSKYLCDLAHTRFASSVSGQPEFTFPASASKLSNWQITSFGLGLETSDTVLGSNGSPVPEGNAAMTVQISDLHLKKYPNLNETYNGCSY